MPNRMSENLRSNIDKIANIWELRVRKEVESAPNQEPVLFRNSLTEYLSKVADSLSVTLDRNQLRQILALKQAALMGKKHGRERAKTLNYTIDQLIFEYHILRQVIFEVLEETMVLSSIERDVIIDSIEQSVNDAATEFSDFLKEVQETLSRTLVHDLRNPLSIAKLCLGLIESDLQNAEHNKLIKGRISINLDRIDSMIYHLLDTSIIKAGQRLPLHVEQIDLTELIKKVANDFNFIGPSRFFIKTPETLKGFWDPSGLTRIIENLVANALKYGDTETPILISAERDGNPVKIVIHNCGNPISLEDQSIIFKKFERANAPGDQPGWGLGLTVVKSIAEAHGGNVKVESLENKGTTFTVELPLDCRELAIDCH